MHAQMLNAYSNFISPHSPTPGTVDPREAQELIDIAQDLNAQGGGCCGGSTRKGDNELRELVALHGDHFQPESWNLVQNYLSRPVYVSRPVIAAPVVVGVPVAARRPFFNWGNWNWNHWGIRHNSNHHIGGHHGGHR